MYIQYLLFDRYMVYFQLFISSSNKLVKSVPSFIAFISSSIEEPGYEILERAGKARGFLISGGEVNTERMAKTLLDEFREGILGRITLENVSEANREPLEKIEFRGMLSEW